MNVRGMLNSFEGGEVIGEYGGGVCSAEALLCA